MDRSDVDTRTDLDPRIESGTYHKCVDFDAQTYVDYALTSLGRRQPMFSNAGADAQHATFCIWDFEVPSAPTTHDRITDANAIVWAILVVHDHLYNTRYHVDCVRMPY